MCICENCGKEHDGSYGSGRFCSKHCRYSWIGKESFKAENRKLALIEARKHSKSTAAPYGTWKCKFCGEVLPSKNKLYAHYHLVHPESVGTFHNKGGTAWNKGKTKETDERILKASITLNTRYANGEIIGSWTGRKHDEATKKKISESRTKYLKEHPSEHPWKDKSKFKSKPCEALKEKLNAAGITFIEEYTDASWTHAYAIDIAFPEKKIGIEVNGNQHYNKDRSLKPYYADRQSYLEKEGWKILNVLYFEAYKEEVINGILSLIK